MYIDTGWSASCNAYWATFILVVLGCGHLLWLVSSCFVYSGTFFLHMPGSMGIGNSKIIDQMNNFQTQAPATTGSELNKAFFLQYQLGDYGVNLILLIII